MKKRSHDSAAGHHYYPAVEFLDIPSMNETLHGAPTLGRSEQPETQLNEVARSNIARQAYDYISRLVRTYQGDDEDVRSVVNVLESKRSAEP